MTNGSFVPPPPPSPGNYSGSTITFGNVLSVVKSKYASGQGRASLREYWFFYLWQIIIGFGGWIAVAVVGIFIGAALGQDAGGALAAILFLLYLVALIALAIPGITTGIRRLHDTGKSGAFLLLGLVPFVGGIILIVLMAMPSQIGPNQYGPQPN